MPGISRPSWRGFSVIAVLSTLAIAIACQRPTSGPTSTTEAPRREGTFDQRVDIGGLKLHIHCEGRGVPLVVFESGLGQGSEAWARVLGPVASLTRSCVYDRANHGQSDRARVPHSNRQMARELYTLLTNAVEPGPYVLVGHSMGGTNVQLFLEEHPTSVAGMVLVDASPEPPPIDRIPPAAMAEFERNIATLEGLDLKTLLGGFDELRASKRTLGDKPLVILVAGRALEDPNFHETQAERLLTERQHAQERLLGLSSNSALVLVKNSAHHIPNEAPETVLRAVQAVVEAARRRGRLSGTFLLAKP